MTTHLTGVIFSDLLILFWVVCFICTSSKAKQPWEKYLGTAEEFQAQLQLMPFSIFTLIVTSNVGSQTQFQKITPLSHCCIRASQTNAQSFAMLCMSRTMWTLANASVGLYFLASHTACRNFCHNRNLQFDQLDTKQANQTQWRSCCKLSPLVVLPAVCNLVQL